MRDPRKVIILPLVTEKALKLKEKSNVYTFQVDKSANKIEIKHAVEALFKVKVLDVNTQCCKGKEKRVGRYIGYKPAWKKAICKLKEGDKIEIFEGVG
ncbi:MAG: 50S ribosomal protein L23 [bacterium]|nr:50S ribosomal protein L23 [bacterium]